VRAYVSRETVPLARFLLSWRILGVSLAVVLLVGVVRYAAFDLPEIVVWIVADSWGVWLCLLGLLYMSCRHMECVGSNDELVVALGPLRSREFVIPYGAMTSAMMVAAVGRPWCSPRDGVLCTYGPASRQATRLVLDEPWGPEGLTEITIVVPDPERLAGFLNERIAGAEA
jgi:hypothetical protein